MTIINVGLYGGKNIFRKGESPLEASIIHCSKTDQCSFYARGECWNVRSILGQGCTLGDYVESKKGYTSRAKKYGEFKSNWQSHEEYNKLKYPVKRVGLIGDYVVFPYSHIGIKVQEDNITFINPYITNNKDLIPLRLFDEEFIYRLCKFKPQAMFGGNITDYTEQEIPNFLIHLKEVLPELYNSFVNKYTEFDTIRSNVGRKALIVTLNPCKLQYTASSYPELNSEWYWDGEYLTYESGYVSRFNIDSNAEVVEIKLKPNKESLVVISDDNQVNENTVFKS